MSSFGVNDYLGLTVTYDGSNRPIYCKFSFSFLPFAKIFN
jgi:hypothetical protein